jgi:hypothetical protein
MNSTKQYFIWPLLFLLSSELHGQLYKKLDLEIAMNYTKVQNKFEFNRNSYFIGNDGYENRIYHENPAMYLNYNVTIGWEMSPIHKLRIKYGSNDSGMKLSSENTKYVDGGVLIQSSYFYGKNTVKIWALGLQYENCYPLEKDNILLAIGLDRQVIDYTNVNIPFEGLGNASYAAYFSFGYEKYIFKQFSFILRGYINNSFPTDEKHYNYGIDFLSSFSPIQYGGEIAFRKSFE